MRKTFALLLLFLISLGCSKEKKIPEGVLPKEKMIEVMVDFQVVEAAILQQQNHLQDVKFYTNYYYDSVLKKNGISRQEFKRSIDWYKNNMEELDKMYGEVLTRLSKLQENVK